jgi:hypothetical protein
MALPDLKATLTALSKSGTKLSKDAAAIITAQGIVIDEANAHLAARSTESMFQQNEMLHAETARLQSRIDELEKQHDRVMAMTSADPTQPTPPITSMIAFDISTERINCAAIAMMQINNAFTVGDLASRRIDELLRMLQARIADRILAQPKPIVAFRT